MLCVVLRRCRALRAFERPSTPAEALERAALALQAQRFAEAERLAADVLKADRGNAAAARLLGQDAAAAGPPQGGHRSPAPRRAPRRRPGAGDPAGPRARDAGRGEDALAALRLADHPPARLSPGPSSNWATSWAGSAASTKALAVFEAGLALAPTRRFCAWRWAYLQLCPQTPAPRPAPSFEQVRAAAPDAPRRSQVRAGQPSWSWTATMRRAAELYRGALAFAPRRPSHPHQPRQVPPGDGRARSPAKPPAAKLAQTSAGLPGEAIAAARRHAPRPRLPCRPSDAARFLNA